jgi:hypothetical protein
VVRYTFTARDLHSLLLAGLPGAPKFVNFISNAIAPPAEIALLSAAPLAWRRRVHCSNAFSKHSPLAALSHV